MAQPRKVSALALAKNAWRLVRHPAIASRLLGLEASKLFFDFLNPRAGEGYARQIRSIVLRPTDLCNLRCRVCGQWGEHGYQFARDPKSFKEKELPVSRYAFLLEDLRRRGQRPLLVLLGGEPMLYEGIGDLIEAAADLGLPVMMTTNGTGVAALAPRLVHAPLVGLQLSIDGHTPELHNRLRPGAGKVNNFAQIEAALTAVRQVREESGRQLPLITAITVISRENAGHLVDIYETFRKRVDFFVFCLSWWIDEAACRAYEADFFRRFGFTPHLHRGYLSGSKPQDFHLLYRQLNEIRHRSRAWNAPPLSIIPPLSSAADLETYYTDHGALFGQQRCTAIFQEMQIMSDGRVTPCRSYIDYPVGNVKDATLTELWNSPAYVNFRRSLMTEGLMPVCSRCCGLLGF
ncbi:MAG: SPASM domain-containing protein [Syntrophales bacterium]|nr:SPASM domain-containing protein [Syntrophales bacterium]MDD5642305.1 SPASM domain-containing protein [Syntrophales bacterium]